MKATIALVFIAFKQLLRSRRFLAVSILFYCALFCFSFLIQGEGPPGQAVRFYVQISWMALFAFCLVNVLLFPLSVFSSEREQRICFLLGTKPVSRCSFIAARYAGSVILGVCLIACGALVLAAGASVVAVRCDGDLSVLEGCRIYPVPGRDVSKKDAARLVEELSRDPVFLQKHGREGVIRIVRKTLSMQRLKTGEERTIVWRGIRPGTGDGTIRFTPRIYPPLEDVQLVFTVGGGRYERFVTPQKPGMFSFPLEAVRDDGTLAVDIRVDSADEAQVYFPRADGLSVYVPEILFAENLLRAALLLAVFLAAMAPFGVLSGSSFSFPVGLLAVTLMVVIGLGYPIFLSAADVVSQPGSHSHHQHHEQNQDGIREWMKKPVFFIWENGMKAILRVFPDFGKVRPSEALVNGHMIQLSVIVKTALTEFVLRGFVVLLLAWFFYSRRELGKRHSFG